MPDNNTFREVDAPLIIKKSQLLLNDLFEADNIKTNNQKSLRLLAYLQDLILGIANQTHVLTCIDAKPHDNSVLGLTIFETVIKCPEYSIDIDPKDIYMLLEENILIAKRIMIRYLDHTENYHYQFFVQELPE